MYWKRVGHCFNMCGEYVEHASTCDGHVVDMLQFPMVTWNWPSWIPYIGGESFTFFEPVFNIADTAISTGVGIMIVFNKRIFP